MRLGVFLPTGTQGFVITTAPPLLEPSWELCREISVLAEEVGFDFSMSMIKLRGFGGPSRFWDDDLDSLTLMSGIAAATKRIKLIATVPILAVHPAIAARQAMTLNEISGGRLILNIVTGWSKSEYGQYGLWPGEDHYTDRYAYATEYVRIMQDFWSTGRSNFKGKYFEMNHAQCLPMPPSRRIPIVCAGRSEAGLRFTAQAGDWAFVNGDFDQLEEAKRNLDDAGAAAGRKLKTLPNLHPIIAATDAEAQERYQHIVDHADHEAIERMRTQMGMNVRPGGTGGTAAAFEKVSTFAGTIPIIGSYERVADILLDLYGRGFTDGFMFQFSDYLQDVRAMADHVMPRLQAAKAS